MKICKTGLEELLDIVRSSAYIINDVIKNNDYLLNLDECSKVKEQSDNLIKFTDYVVKEWDIYSDESS